MTERERDSLVVALNYWMVNRGRGDWGAQLCEMHMEADGIKPLTGPMADKLMKRLERGRS